MAHSDISAINTEKYPKYLTGEAISLDNENQAKFKKLIIEGGQKFLKALNPNWPDPLMPINGNCTIVGKVVFTGKSL
ncbi:S24 family peptidase [Pseudoalteromonas sp. T1lg88]|uniref:S24 family peptidase n=1 Tax=Pseudoalteromonas sp. T1lg88 TaxID=2077104 RepID=UPI001F15E95E|nr:S24 family peptidase [Pseudoalteromonas sp. T1lg88]